jgi:eukaryotic-like serine/threonine-protein kinase
MEKRTPGPKAGPSAGGKAPAKPAKAAPDDATQVAAEGALAPVNAGEPAPPPAPTEELAVRGGQAPEDRPPEEEAAARAGADVKPAAREPARASVLGDFRLLKRLGAGGMGAVYKAHQISLDREVAVKVLSKELAAKPAFVQRFLREARVMARLDHPNLLRCYEVKEVRGLHYIAMEYVDGGSVESWLEKLGRFELGDALHLIIACARALGHAHDKGLVHRDVKPDNVLLTSRGVVKLADLGLAKAHDDDLSVTRTGTGAGTPVYMAPEQARNVKHVDGRSDLYALGSMLYRFVTGELPFKGDTLVELIEAKEKGKFTPARRLNDEVPERLDLILDKLLACKPEVRYQSCAELLEDLEGLGLANERLSFLGPGEDEGEEEPAPRPARAPARPARPAEPRKPREEHYYASFKDVRGKPVTKKMTEAEVLGAIRSGSFTADTQLSRTLKGGYRALATYREFEPTLRAHMTKAAADRKGQKYRAMYEQIEKEEARRQRMRWLHNLVLRAGGWVGFVLWMAVVAGICVGGYFVIRWLLGLAGDWLSKL